jgi:SAM-dependent methyltransferase
MGFVGSTDLFDRPEFVEALHKCWDDHARSGLFDPLQEIAQRIVKSGIVSPSVIDVGSGRGRLYDFIQQADPNYGFYYMPCDKSAALLSEVVRLHPRIEPWRNVKCPIYKIPASHSAYDVVVCHAVLYHIGDIPAALAELWRITRKVLYVTFLWHGGIRHKGVFPYFYENHDTGYAEWCPGNVVPAWMIKRLVHRKLDPKASSVRLDWYKPPKIVERSCLVEAWKC